MTAPLVKALSEHHQIPVVDESNVDAVLSADKPTLLLFAGDPVQNPEGSDLAVILPQILAAFKGAVQGAVVAAAAETALKPRFQVLVLPSLVLTRNGPPLDVFPKVVGWSEYTARIERALATI
jgi:hydrogenase-1 operon protein HyaE